MLGLLKGDSDCRFCGQYFMVSFVAQLHVRMHLDIYMLYINHFAGDNPDSIETATN